MFAYKYKLEHTRLSLGLHRKTETCIYHQDLWNVNNHFFIAIVLFFLIFKKKNIINTKISP